MADYLTKSFLQHQHHYFFFFILSSSCQTFVTFSIAHHCVWRGFHGRICERKSQEDIIHEYRRFDCTCGDICKCVYHYSGNDITGPRPRPGRKANIAHDHFLSMGLGAGLYQTVHFMS